MTHDPQHLRALVDMGSNGIRLSITTLSHPLTRLLPTLYLSRVPISLYDAQYSPSSPTRVPIPAPTITAVLSALKRFRSVCASFRIPDSQVTILATEATRTAVNSAAFLAAIKEGTGWDVALLSKAQEAETGAWGVLSSVALSSISTSRSRDGKGGGRAVALDVGGGSAQLSLFDVDGSGVKPGKGVSLPFGAAALSRRLNEAKAQGTVGALEADVRQGVEGAWKELNPSGDRDGAGEGITLYVSGGGMRGWGFVLMASHAVQPYPVAVVNGFSADRSTFLSTDVVEAAAAASLSTTTSDDDDDDSDSGSSSSKANKGDNKIHRVSTRRATQVPAVSLLISALSTVLPIDKVQFCQGGVREGHFFSSLGPSIQAQHPLVVATSPFASPGATRLAELLAAALPTEVFGGHAVQALAQMMGHMAGWPKDVVASAALRFSTTGALAAAHGLAHRDRAVLGVLLCERHGGLGDLPPAERQFYESLVGLLTREERWWAGYLGRVAGMLGSVYPAGVVEGEKERVKLKVHVGEGKKGPRVEVKIKVREEWRGVVEDEIKTLEKIGKKKNWVGGREGWGLGVKVTVDEW
ncbi:hypothetical protein K461DRAFT_294356 [Myriangium duriaei CBS 260.36]|uniref:Ppx/GppA phosphatase domain-containing protein n=1 Tax=Myriangium duriaei CBS 260.36 TaxID=1168546 RepID=A0A9P4MH20_9PEZI|nr:hypothetical protein K461DRAFT_294356 [Myriangium duriaei CBS 260.36]